MSEAYAIDPILQAKSWSLREAYAYCERLTRKHYENFPVGSVLIPKRLRPHVWAVYAFARRADDIADEDFPESERLPALQAWDALLEKSLSQPVSHPIFIALQKTIAQFKLPPQLLHDLVAAFQMDVRVKRHARFEDLLYYCRHSANPVGRLVLLLFGYREERLHLLSDKICTALQLANFWQDLAVDQKKGRLYVPLEDMERFGYREEEYEGLVCNARFRELMAFEVERTRKLFQEGMDLPGEVKGRLRWELRAVILGGMRILEKIAWLDYDTLSRRPVLSKIDPLRLLWRGAFRFRKSVLKPAIPEPVRE